MRSPPGLPARIRTDATNPFAHHTMSVRVPAILDDVRQHNRDLAPAVHDRLIQLAAALRGNLSLPALDPTGPHAEPWQRALAARAGERWLQTDWFFAENYAYRLACDAVDFWQTGRDPFRPTKLAEYRSAGHRAALNTAAALDGAPRAKLAALLSAAVFGNRMDLSFAASRERGVTAALDDLLIDDRSAAIEALTSEGSGPVHIVIDNAGTELSVDLVLASRLLELDGASVVLHVKSHPCFVSDAIAADVHWFLEGEDEDARQLWQSASEPARRCRLVAREGLASGRITLAPHPFWNSAGSLWEAPPDLEQAFAAARLVVLKGDAHYRRALGDALWPADTPTRAATSYFPAPLLLLRTLKSDPIVGLAAGQAAALDAADPRWRVNGQRGIAALGGR
jgi:hypothetical protein